MVPWSAIGPPEALRHVIPNRSGQVAELRPLRVGSIDTSYCLIRNRAILPVLQCPFYSAWSPFLQSCHLYGQSWTHSASAFILTYSTACGCCFTIMRCDTQTAPRKQ